MGAVKVNHPMPGDGGRNLDVAAARHLPDFFACFKIVTAAVFIPVYSYLGFISVVINGGSAPAGVFISFLFPDFLTGFDIEGCNK